MIHDSCVTGYGKELQSEHTFINLNQSITFARQICVFRQFSAKLFKDYSDCSIVGFTLNKTKTQVIRLFYNKHASPEGDRVCESVLFQNVKCKIQGPFLHPNYYEIL